MILAILGAKITENQTPLVCFASLFCNQTVFQKFECSLFEQVVTDAKHVQTFEKHPLLTELKLKTKNIAHSVIFSISPLPAEGGFQMLTHFMATWSKKLHSNF